MKMGDMPDLVGGSDLVFGGHIDRVMKVKTIVCMSFCCVGRVTTMFHIFFSGPVIRDMLQRGASLLREANSLAAYY